MLQLVRGALGVVLFSFLSQTALAVDFGRTPGGFEVSGSGAATYHIPIWTPPGPNGVHPDISLVYDSQGSNGVAGFGWELSALSSIARCARTKHQDGSNEGFALAVTDRLCIGGSRMRLVTGSYGAAGSVYQTELADYSRIKAFGTAGNGPQYFVVEAKSGLKYEYGATTNSRVYAGVSPTIATTPHVWMLNKVYDRNGNNYVISYNNLNGFAVPDVISWTPTSFGAGTYRYEAKFNYSTRVDIDSYIGKIYSFDVANRYRLENIQIKSAGVVKRKYRLAYDTSSVTSRSRLTSAKECGDDAETNCLLPLTFTYQSGQAGVTPGSGTPPAGSSNGIVKGRYDLNGDGKDDIVYSSGGFTQVAFGANTGFAGPYSTGISTTMKVGRFVPTGRDAIATIIGGTVWIYRWDDGTAAFTGYNTGVASGDLFPVDYDGDGLADLVTQSVDKKQLYVRRNTSTGSGNPSFAASTFLAATLPASAYGGTPTFYSMWTYFGKGLQYTDVNGDGRQDFHVLIHVQLPMGVSMYSAVILGSSAGFYIPPSASWSPYLSVDFPSINFNGDHCNDRLGGSTIYISQCNGVAASTVTTPATPLNVIDWNGDGKTDILVDSGGNFAVYLATGTGFSGPIATTIPSAGTFFAIDQDGDGQEDLIRVNGTSAISYWTHTPAGNVPATFATNIPDLLSSVTDGFGVSHSLTYESTAWGSYSQGAATSYPLQESDPRVVVTQLTTSNGIGGTFNRTYYYVGARDHAERGDFAGFQRVDETDSRNGLITRRYFEQSFPVSGMLSQYERMQPNGTTTISRTVFTNTFATLDSTANNQRYFPYSSGSTTTEYEVAGVWNGALLRTVTVSNIYETTGGALYDQTVTTTEPASGANGLTAGGVWTERTYAPLASLVNHTPTWCIGRPGLIQKINSHNLTYGTSITRTTNLTWNSTDCRPTQVVDEQGSGTPLEVITGIGYDSFGNVNSQTVTGAGMTARTSTMTYSDATYTTGQFPLSATNALSQISKTAWNYDLGVPISVTDPNDIALSWQYDAFGRRTREDRADGTATTWSINNCTAVSGGCVGANNKTVVIETAIATGGTYVNDLWTYLDAFNRSIITTTRTAGGSYNRVDREFDSLGRVYRQSAPCIWASCTTYWTTNSYDLANRPTAVSRPMSESIATLQATNIYYEGLTTRIVDAQSKQSARVFNSNRQLYRTTDHDNYYQSFEYDPFGNPKRIQDTNGNVLQSSTYNLRGMLTQRVDLDMGTWNFTPNALGETVSQTDAKSQTTTFVFDLLGRLTSRTETEGTSTWTWGTSSASKNIGKLAAIAGPGYSESYTYDSLGRPSNTAITSDTTYQIDYAYNSLGVLDTLTYPTSTSSYRLKLQYDYQYGQLYRIKDFNAPSTVFWTANAVNGRNQITQETLGNGLVTNRAYDAVTSWLKTIQTGIGGGTGVQNLAYTWDLAGNLSSRKDVNQSNLTESFVYDNLYRLDSSELNGVPNLDLSYDTLGNITNKSDVGTYTYHAIKRHQLISTSNGWTFGYDNNGNMTSGRGATITWTSYNYTSQINNAGLTSDFYYTPNRQYFKQVASFSTGTATTMYVGGILEKVTTTAGTDYRHRIRAGGSTVIVSRQTSGTNGTHYVTSDHLGSSAAITNGSGGILVNSSFDAFGKRRGANWTGSPSAGDWTAIASTTRRGYTEHSMLDNVNFIHMNGRAQDPILGRFLSGDPYVTEPLNTQNYNRYSYVYNNPMSTIDPSGFGADPPCLTCKPEDEVVVEGHRDTARQDSFGSEFGDAMLRADSSSGSIGESESGLEEIVVTGEKVEDLEEIVVTGLRKPPPARWKHCMSRVPTTNPLARNQKASFMGGDMGTAIFSYDLPAATPPRGLGGSSAGGGTVSGSVAGAAVGMPVGMAWGIGAAETAHLPVVFGVMEVGHTAFAGAMYGVRVGGAFGAAVGLVNGLDADAMLVEYCSE